MNLLDNHGAYSKFKSRSGLNKKNDPEISLYILGSSIHKKFKGIEYDEDILRDGQTLLKAKDWASSVSNFSDETLRSINHRLKKETPLEILKSYVLKK